MKWNRMAITAALGLATIGAPLASARDRCDRDYGRYQSSYSRYDNRGYGAGLFFGLPQLGLPELWLPELQLSELRLSDERLRPLFGISVGGDIGGDHRRKRGGGAVVGGIAGEARARRSAR